MSDDAMPPEGAGSDHAMPSDGDGDDAMLSEGAGGGDSDFEDYLLVDPAVKQVLGHELYVATSHGDADRVWRLLANGADPEYGYDPAGSGRSALEEACRRGDHSIAESLLAANADPVSAVHEVGVSRDLRLAKLLIRHGADPDRCLRCAVGHGRLADAIVETRDLAGVDPASLLRMVQTPAAAHALLADPRVDPNARDARLGCAALHEACRRGGVEVVRLLLADCRVDVDARNDAGQTPLQMLAYADARGGGGDICAVAAALLQRGADVHATDREGATALHASCQFGLADLAEVLLSSGADANRALPCSRHTPLHLACFGPLWDLPRPDARWEKTAQYERTIVALLRRGASGNARDAEGRTPLHIATRYLYHARAAVDALLAHGADPNVRDYKVGETPLHCQCRRLPSYHWRGTPLSRAEQRKIAARCGLIELLVASGAHADTLNVDGESCLDTWRRAMERVRAADPALAATTGDLVTHGRHMKLQCLAARALLRAGVPTDAVPAHLREFVSWHARPTAEDALARGSLYWLSSVPFSEMYTDYYCTSDSEEYSNNSDDSE